MAVEQESLLTANCRRAGKQPDGLLDSSRDFVTRQTTTRYAWAEWMVKFVEKLEEEDQ